MPTFSNSPIPREPRPEAAREETATQLKAVTEASVCETPAPVAEVPADEAPAEETVAVATAETSESAANEATPPAPSEPPKPAEPPMPWAIVVRHFADAPDEAYKKLNGDFSLSLDGHSFRRLQKLFRTVLHRDPTAGELCILDTLDRVGQDLPRREAVGELYTNSEALAETWADMMAKHAELFAAAGLLRKGTRVPPPCTFEEALTLVGRYLHRAGLVTPLSDGLPFGGKNSDGRIAVLASPDQEADALARGYTRLQAMDFENATRSVWVRHGAAMAVTPEKAGDFLVLLSAPSPEALATMLEAERRKSRPSVGAICALAGRSPLEAVMTLCGGADLYPARFPARADEPGDGPTHLLRLCRIPRQSTDYLLRVPAKKVRELSEALRAASITAISVGQVKSGGHIRIHLRQGEKDIPVANLTAELLRTYPATALYRRHVEVIPTPLEIPAATVLPLPEAGLIAASASLTVTAEGTGYAAAMEAVAAAVAPLTEDGTSTRHVHLSVALTAADGEGSHGNMTLETLCGLYRAAAEGGMAVEDPAFTPAPVAEGEAPAVRLSVVAYRRA